MFDKSIEVAYKNTKYKVHNGGTLDLSYTVDGESLGGSRISIEIVVKFVNEKGVLVIKDPKGGSYALQNLRPGDTSNG